MENGYSLRNLAKRESGIVDLHLKPTRKSRENVFSLGPKPMLRKKCSRFVLKVKNKKCLHININIGNVKVNQAKLGINMPRCRKRSKPRCNRGDLTVYLMLTLNALATATCIKNAIRSLWRFNLSCDDV